MQQLEQRHCGSPHGEVFPPGVDAAPTLILSVPYS